MYNTKDECRNFWNIRAKTFPGHKEGESYQMAMLAAADRLGVVFKDKKVMDLGCGAGSYTIHLAREAEHVTALDISEVMLEKVNQSAGSNGLNNVTCVCADWMDYESDEKFDVIFCSLTPALRDEGAVEKLLKYADENSQIVVISFASPIRAYTLEELFELHGLENNLIRIGSPVKEWLTKNNIPYRAERVQGEWESLRTFDEMIENCKDVIVSRNVEPKMDLIREFAEKFRTDKGMYRSVTAYDVEMIVWDLPSAV